MIHLFVITFGRLDLLPQQKRLFDKYLQDSHTLHVIDNTPDPSCYRMQTLCRSLGVSYMLSPSKKREHHEALNFAALIADRLEADFFGFLDHDVFPRREATLVDKIEDVGFYGIGQAHPPTGKKYLWPGFCFFSRSWLNGRSLDFGGIRGRTRREDGDTGSLNWPLFTDEDWNTLWGMEHGYRAIREPDNEGLQSWGIELLGDFIHFTNASHWKEIPDPQGRDAALAQIIHSL